MQLGISSYLTSAGLNATVTAGALGPSFSPKYFLPIYSPTWDKLIRQGTSGTSTSAVNINSLGLWNATDNTLDSAKIEKIFADKTYTISDKIFVYYVNGVGVSGSDAQFSSSQNAISEVNLLNNKPLSLGISASSYNYTSNGLITPTGRYDFAQNQVMDITQFNPISGSNPPLSAYYRVASYSPSVENEKTKGIFKCRIPASNSSFKFNGIALYLTKTDINGFDDNGFGVSMFNFKPVLFAIVLFDQAQFKDSSVGGLNDYEINVELSFDYDTINATNSGNPVYIETNYWTKLPTSTTTSAYGLNYDGDVVISTSAINDSWNPRAKLTVVDNQKEQLRLSNDKIRFTDFRTKRFSWDGGISSDQNDRAVLDIDTSCPEDSLIQIGKDVFATGVKSIALGCETSAVGYKPFVTIFDPSLDGGYTFAQGVESIAGGFGSVAMGQSCSAIGFLNHAYGKDSIAGSLDENVLDGYDLNTREREGLNFAFGKGVSALSIDDQGSVNSNYYGSFIDRDQNRGGNIAFGYRTLANGGVSFATGIETSATGYMSKAEGYKTLASGVNSIAFGDSVSATQRGSIVFGYNSKNLNVNSVLFGSKSTIGEISDNESDNNHNYLFGTESFLFGRMNFVVGKNVSIRGKQNNIIGSDNVSVGGFLESCSILGTFNNIHGSKIQCHIVGVSNNIKSDSGYIFGASNTIDAFSNFSTIIGGNNVVSANTVGLSDRNSATSVLGNRNYIVGLGNQIIGINNSISGSFNTILGFRNKVSESDNITSEDTRTFLFGKDNTIISDSSKDGTYLIGEDNTVSGGTNIIFGRRNNVESLYSTVIGRNLFVTGEESIAIGSISTVTGESSISLGSNNNISNSKNIVIGNDVVSKGDNEIVIGSCNTDRIRLNAKEIDIGIDCQSKININISTEEKWKLEIYTHFEDSYSELKEFFETTNVNDTIANRIANRTHTYRINMKKGNISKTIDIRQNESDAFWWDILSVDQDSCVFAVPLNNKMYYYNNSSFRNTNQSTKFPHVFFDYSIEKFVVGMYDYPVHGVSYDNSDKNFVDIGLPTYDDAFEYYYDFDLDVNSSLVSEMTDSSKQKFDPIFKMFPHQSNILNNKHFIMIFEGNQNLINHIITDLHVDFSGQSIDLYVQMKDRNGLKSYGRKERYVKLDLRNRCSIGPNSLNGGTIYSPIYIHADIIRGKYASVFQYDFGDNISSYPALGTFESNDSTTRVFDILTHVDGYADSKGVNVNNCYEVRQKFAAFGNNISIQKVQKIITYTRR